MSPSGVFTVSVSVASLSPTREIRPGLLTVHNLRNTRLDPHACPSADVCWPPDLSVAFAKFVCRCPDLCHRPPGERHLNSSPVDPTACREISLVPHFPSRQRAQQRRRLGLLHDQNVRKSSKPENILFGRSYLVKSEKKTLFFGLVRKHLCSIVLYWDRCQARPDMDPWGHPTPSGRKNGAGHRWASR